MRVLLELETATILSVAMDQLGREISACAKTFYS